MDGLVVYCCDRNAVLVAAAEQANGYPSSPGFFRVCVLLCFVAVGLSRCQSAIFGSVLLLRLGIRTLAEQANWACQVRHNGITCRLVVVANRDTGTLLDFEVGHWATTSSEKETVMRFCLLVLP